MRVLGIDPSSSITGLALVDGEEVLAVDAWYRPKNGTAPQRLLEFFEWLTAWIRSNHPIDMASIEFLSVERNAQATRVISHYQGVSALACKRAGLMVIEGRVRSARKIVLDNGALSKREAFDLIKARYPKAIIPHFDKGGADISDAIVMALAGPSLAES